MSGHSADSHIYHEDGGSRFSEMLVHVWQIVQHYIQTDSQLQ